MQHPRHSANIQIRVQQSTAFPPSAFRNIHSRSSQKMTRGLAFAVRASPTFSHTASRSDAKNPCAFSSQHATQMHNPNATTHPSTRYYERRQPLPFVWKCVLPLHIRRRRNYFLVSQKVEKTTKLPFIQRCLERPAARDPRLKSNRHPLPDVSTPSKGDPCPTSS